MNKAKLLLIIFTIFSISGYSQIYLAKKWDHTYGGNDLESMTSLLQTSDGGFIIGGHTRSDSSGSIREATRGGSDYWIIKTDSMGIKLWDKRFGGNFYERMFSMDKTTDGGFILGGFTTSDMNGDVSEPTHGSMDFWIVKTDSTGNKLWDKRYGGSDYDQLSSVIQCNDGGYLAGGWTYSDSTGDVTQHSHGGEDFWIVKTDSMGNIEWDKRYGGNQTEELSSMQQTTDGGYMLGGFTMSDSSGDVSQPIRGASDFWVVKIDEYGNIEWDKRFGGSSGEGLSSLVQTPDKGYLFSGGTGSDTSGDVTQLTRDTSLSGSYRGDLWIVKTDSLGNKLWDKRYGGNSSDGGGALSQTNDGGFLLGGTSSSSASGEKSENNFGTTQSWVIKIDSVGNKLWDKTLLTLLPDGSANPIQLFDGCYVIANNSQSGIGGHKTEVSFGDNDYWVIKFCESEHPQLPVAGFTVNSSVLCAGGCFDFMNSSFNSSSFQWYFPGGNPSSSTSPFPPSICYTDSGTYDVILIAMNNDGNDTLIQTAMITVLPPPEVTITQHGDTLFATPGRTRYFWFLNNNLILNDTNYYHVVTQNGDYMVLAFDSNYCSNRDTMFSVIVGLHAFSTIENSISVYPNPVTDELRIKGLELSEQADVIITDIAGRVIFNSQINSANTSIPVYDFTPGIYIIDIQFGENKFITRFVRE